KPSSKRTTCGRVGTTDSRWPEREQTVARVCSRGSEQLDVTEREAERGKHCRLVAGGAHGEPRPLPGKHDARHVRRAPRIDRVVGAGRAKKAHDLAQRSGRGRSEDFVQHELTCRSSTTDAKDREAVARTPIEPPHAV